MKYVMSKEDRIKTFFYFVQGALKADVPEDAKYRVIKNEVKEIEELES